MRFLRVNLILKALPIVFMLRGQRLIVTILVLLAAAYSSFPSSPPVLSSSSFFLRGLVVHQTTRINNDSATPASSTNIHIGSTMMYINHAQL